MSERIWWPLESSPEVFTSMAKTWGLSSQYSFVDVLGLDDELLAYTPRPVHAVIFLFPDTPEIVDVRMREGPGSDLPENQPKGAPLYIPQIDVGHSCGTFALLHCLAQTGLAPGLDNFFNSCRSSTPEGRTKLFSESDDIYGVHTAHVAAGQTRVRDSDWDDADHFIAFVSGEVDGQKHLFEMDGCPPKRGPLDRGVMNTDDFLGEVAKVVKDVYIATAGDNVHFSLIALVG